MHKHLYRTILIYGIVVVSLILVYPTLGWLILSPEQEQARLEQWAEEDAVYEEPAVIADTVKAVRRWAECDRSRVINLGLDLQGGVHMVIGFDLTQEQQDEGISEKYIQQLVLQRIRRRINEFEAKEPIIQALGEDQIQIQLPGVKDPERAVNLIMKTAYLTFHIVAGREETTAVFRAIKEEFPDQFTPFLEPPAPGSPFFKIPADYAERVRRVVAKAQEVPDLIPEDKVVAFSQPPNPWDDYQGYYIYVMDKDELLTGERLERAVARPSDDNPNNWQILFGFQGQSRRQFGEATGANVGRSMAIVLDGVVCSAPTIQEKIEGAGTITGAFSGEQAKDLAIALSSGSMPVQLREDYTGVVGASLGADSVRKGITSSVVGIALVALFMVFYYRLSGLIANIALLMNATIVLAALAYFGATLTLPGIAGLILTVGMAVDANVLIFERIREELRLGKSLMAAIDSGYSRVTVTILDANVTTLIAAAVLMEFGTGPIEGFAVTLSIGVCASVFTALVVTRAVLDFLTDSKKLARLTMRSLIKPDTKFAFLAKRRVAFIGSAALIAVGMVVFGARGADNFGVDFTQGTNMIVALDTDAPVEVGMVRGRLEAAGFDSPIVQEYGVGVGETGSRFVIRVGDSGGEGEGEVGGGEAAPETPEEGPAETAAPPTSESDEEGATQAPSEEALPEQADTTIHRRVQEALAGLVGGEADHVVLEKVETVGPAIGKELRNDALKAISYALIFIVAYLWFRFELKFAVGAVVALIHDVLITVGLFALLGRQISMPVIAALLTIIGYSLNDTIVVFDRIREDMRLYRGRGLAFTEILDLSINQTLSRTLLTSLTTLFVVVVLAIFGGIAIRDFALALIAGVLVGTYSSIFVASPVVYLWQKFQGKHLAPAAVGRAEGARGGKKNHGNKKD